MDAIRVLVVDDHDMVRRGLAAFLKATPDLALVGEARNGEQAVQLAAELQPDVVLMDLRMPGMSGTDATRAIRAGWPHVQVVALTSFGEQELVHEALDAGAIGYLLKNVTAGELAQAIRAACAGRITLAPEATQALVEGARHSDEEFSPDLTPRETDVLALMVEGLTNPQIAARLVVSRATVRTHVSSILMKLGAATRSEAVALALRHKLIQ